MKSTNTVYIVHCVRASCKQTLTSCIKPITVGEARWANLIRDPFLSQRCLRDPICLCTWIIIMMRFVSAPSPGTGISCGNEIRVGKKRLRQRGPDRRALRRLGNPDQSQLFWWALCSPLITVSPWPLLWMRLAGAHTLSCFIQSENVLPAHSTSTLLCLSLHTRPQQHTHSDMFIKHMEDTLSTTLSS